MQQHGRKGATYDCIRSFPLQASCISRRRLSLFGRQDGDVSTCIIFHGRSSPMVILRSHP